MASGILGSADLTASTNTTVYTVPSSKVASFSINVCNRGSDAIGVRIAVAASATPANAEWIEYDASIPANGVLERTGLVAGAGKLVVVYASTATTSVMVYGYEE